MSQILPSVSLDNSGVLRPTTMDEAWRMANAHASSGILPERFHGKPAMVFSAMQLAYELGLKPLTALRQIAVVKGTPCIFGDLPLSLAYASRRLRSIKEVWLDKNMKEISLENGNLTAEVYAAFCSVIREGDSEPATAFFTMDEARNANLLQSDAWKKYPKRMLRYRARSQALKDKFPDALNGIAIAEYDLHETDETILINNGKVPSKPTSGLSNILDAEVTDDSGNTKPADTPSTDSSSGPISGVEPSPEGGEPEPTGQGSEGADSDSNIHRAPPIKRGLSKRLADDIAGQP